MKNILLGLLVLSTSAFAGGSGSICYGSDYIFRGASQAGTPVVHASYTVESEGFYLGAWASQVDFGDTTSREIDYFGGYNLAVTDKVSLDVGYVRYTYDANIDSLEELYVITSFGGLSLGAYQDLDTDDTYAEIGYDLWFVPVVDVKLIYGLRDEDDTFAMLNVTKNVGDYTFGLLIGEDVLDGTASDSLTASLSYNF